MGQQHYNVMARIGASLHVLRADRNMSVDDLAELAKCNSEVMQDVLDGRGSHFFGLDELDMIATACQIEISSLIPRSTALVNASGET